MVIKLFGVFLPGYIKQVLETEGIRICFPALQQNFIETLGMHPENCCGIDSKRAVNINIDLQAAVPR